MSVTALPIPLVTIGLLLASNLFMTLAWHGHLSYKSAPLWAIILISWGIAFFEYVLQVPAKRIGHGIFSAAELKIIQEIITLSVFRRVFGVVSKRAAGVEPSGQLCCIALGGFFIFHKWA